MVFPPLKFYRFFLQYPCQFNVYSRPFRLGRGGHPRRNPGFPYLYGLKTFRKLRVCVLFYPIY